MVAVALLVYIRFAGTETEPVSLPANSADMETETRIPAEELVSATLYYPRRDLAAVLPFVVDVPNRRTDLLEWVGVLVSELSRAPAARVIPLFPAEFRPRSVFRDDKGTLYVDFPGAVLESANAGVELEERTLESLLLTLAANIQGVERLMVLVEGENRETLWGHVYLHQPLVVPPFPESLEETE